jgi:hypothetical protein
MMPISARRSGCLALVVLLRIVPVFAAVPGLALESSPASRDPEMRRIVAKFDAAASSVPRGFRADLTASLARCGRDCDWKSFARSLEESVTLAERKLTDARTAAYGQLKERARSLHGGDAVPGAAGDFSRGIASLEMSALRATAQMTEALSVLKGKNFGGQPLLTTLQLRLASLVYRTPIGWGGTLTFHVAGSPTAYVHIDGYTLSGAAVKVTFTCGGSPLTLETTANDDGRWGVSTTVTLEGTTTCTVTATAGSGPGAGSFTIELNFP